MATAQRLVSLIERDIYLKNWPISQAEYVFEITVRGVIRGMQSVLQYHRRQTGHDPTKKPHQHRNEADSRDNVTSRAAK